MGRRRKGTLGQPTATVRISDRVTRGDVAGLVARAAAVLAEGEDEVVCDVREVARPTLRTVEALCRLRLEASRLGGRVRLRHASVELMELLALCGLSIESALEDERHPEEREESLRIQEEGDPPDALL